jgi:hypothetical protein
MRSVLSLKTAEVEGTLVGIASVPEDDSVLTESVDDATEVDDGIVTSTTGTSVNSGAAIVVEFAASVLADSEEDGDVGEGMLTSAGTSVGPGATIDVELTISVLTDSDEDGDVNEGEGKITSLGTSVKSGVAIEVELATSVLVPDEDEDVVEGRSTSVLGASVMLGRADSVGVAPTIALSSGTGRLEIGMLDDSVALAKTEDVTELVEMGREAFTTGAGVITGISPDKVDVAFAMEVGCKEDVLDATKDEDVIVRVLFAVTVMDTTEVVFTAVAVGAGDTVTLGVDPMGTSSYKLIVQAPPAMIDLSPIAKGDD